MALEVRFVPPRLLLALFLFALLSFPVPSHAQEKTNSSKASDAVEAKARLLQELDQRAKERGEQIAREEEALTALKRALEAAKQELVAEGERLKDLKAEVEADIARREALENERLDQIAKMYAAMRSREAAQALEGMDNSMATAILQRLPGRTVGKIFDVMSKKRVRELTLRLEKGRPKKGE